MLIDKPTLAARRVVVTETGLTICGDDTYLVLSCVVEFKIISRDQESPRISGLICPHLARRFPSGQISLVQFC